MHNYAYVYIESNFVTHWLLNEGKIFEMILEKKNAKH